MLTKIWTPDRCQMACTQKLGDKCAYVAYNKGWRDPDGTNPKGKNTPHCMYYDIFGKGSNHETCYKMKPHHPLLGTFYNL